MCNRPLINVQCINNQHYYSIQAVAARWAATACFSERVDDRDTARAVPVSSGSCMLELQPAHLGQRPKLLNTHGPIRLQHTFQVTVAAQRAAAASQPASLSGE